MRVDSRVDYIEIPDLLHLQAVLPLFLTSRKTLTRCEIVLSYICNAY